MRFRLTIEYDCDDWTDQEKAERLGQEAFDWREGNINVSDVEQLRSYRENCVVRFELF